MNISKNKRDANEAELVGLWRRLGCIWIPQPRENGFDGLLLRNGEMWIVEIKSGLLPPSKRQLTANERAMRERAESADLEYHVIENLKQAADLVRLPFE